MKKTAAQIMKETDSKLNGLRKIAGEVGGVTDTQEKVLQPTRSGQPLQVPPDMKNVKTNFGHVEKRASEAERGIAFVMQTVGFLLQGKPATDIETHLKKLEKDLKAGQEACTTVMSVVKTGKFPG